MQNYVALVHPKGNSNCDSDNILFEVPITAKDSFEAEARITAQYGKDTLWMLKEAPR